MAGWAASMAATLSLAAADAQQPAVRRPLYSEVRAPVSPPPWWPASPISQARRGRAPRGRRGHHDLGRPAGREGRRLRELFDKLNDGPRRGIGSGFVIHRDGWVVTNAHVVEGAGVDRGGPRRGRRGSRRRWSGPTPSPTWPCSRSSRPAPVDRPVRRLRPDAVAEWVLVIGSPFGLDHSVTLGIVSHTGRADISPVGPAGDLRLHPDRRLDQPRQLGRARAQPARRGDRRSPPPSTRRARASASRSPSTW